MMWRLIATGFVAVLVLLAGVLFGLVISGARDDKDVVRALRERDAEPWKAKWTAEQRAEENGETLFL